MGHTWMHDNHEEWMEEKIWSSLTIGQITSLITNYQNPLIFGPLSFFYESSTLRESQIGRSPTRVGLTGGRRWMDHRWPRWPKFGRHLPSLYYRVLHSYQISSQNIIFNYLRLVGWKPHMSPSCLENDSWMCHSFYACGLSFALVWALLSRVIKKIISI